MDGRWTGGGRVVDGQKTLRFEKKAFGLWTGPEWTVNSAFWTVNSAFWTGRLYLTPQPQEKNAEIFKKR